MQYSNYFGEKNSMSENLPSQKLYFDPKVNEKLEITVTSPKIRKTVFDIKQKLFYKVFKWR